MAGMQIIFYFTVNLSDVLQQHQSVRSSLLLPLLRGVARDRRTNETETAKYIKLNISAYDQEMEIIQIQGPCAKIWEVHTTDSILRSIYYCQFLFFEYYSSQYRLHTHAINICTVSQRLEFDSTSSHSRIQIVVDYVLIPHYKSHKEIRIVLFQVFKSAMLSVSV